MHQYNVDTGSNAKPTTNETGRTPVKSKPDDAIRLLEKGREELHKGRIEEAVGSFSKSLDIAVKLGDTWLQIEGLKHLAICHRSSNEASAALKRIVQAIALAMREKSNSTLLSDLGFVHGTVLEQMGFLQHASTIYQGLVQLYIPANLLLGHAQASALTRLILISTITLQKRQACAFSDLADEEFMRRISSRHNEHQDYDIQLLNAARAIGYIGCNRIEDATKLLDIIEAAEQRFQGKTRPSTILEYTQIARALLQLAKNNESAGLQTLRAVVEHCQNGPEAFEAASICAVEHDRIGHINIAQKYTDRLFDVRLDIAKDVIDGIVHESKQESLTQDAHLDHKSQQINTDSKYAAVIEKRLHSYAEAAAFIEDSSGMRLNRLSELGLAFTLELGHEPSFAKTFSQAIVYCDIGKHAIPYHLLAKPSSLTTLETPLVHQYPKIGAMLIRQTGANTPVLRMAAELALSHRERCDGSGYPNRLNLRDIPEAARIASIIVSYDSMTNDRAYRRTLSSEEALSEIRHRAGTQFDESIALHFVAFMSKRNPNA
jgi:HD-GYP domain-containing protein (c-di-GMP phosphodiesterase class II)